MRATLHRVTGRNRRPPPGAAAPARGGELEVVDEIDEVVVVADVEVAWMVVVVVQGLAVWVGVAGALEVPAGRALVGAVAQVRDRPS